MKLNRRSFLISSSSTLIGTIALANYPKEIFGADTEFAFQNASSFRNLIGTSFTFYKNDSAFEAVLTEVKKYAPKSSKFLDIAGSNSKTNSFSLTFDIKEENLQQDYYRIFHPSLGFFGLMLVPGINPKNQAVLTASINRF